MEKSLAKIRPGESGVVHSITSCELSAKLVEMGLYRGKEVRVLYRAPLGDPIAVDVEGYVLSLRLDEAQLVMLEAAF